MARYIVFPPEELIVPNREQSKLTRVSESPTTFSSDFNLFSGLFNIKKNLEILNSLNLHLLDIENDIDGVYNSEYVFEIETKFFKIRASKSFFGILTSFKIEFFKMERVGYFENKFTKQKDKTHTINVPFGIGEFFFNVIKHKINSFEIQKDLKIKEDCVLEPLIIEYNKDDILLLNEIQNVHFNNICLNRKNNITFLVKYIIGHFISNMNLEIITGNFEYIETDRSICFKFLEISSNELKWIYVDVAYRNDIVINNKSTNNNILFYFSNKNFNISNIGDSRIFSFYSLYS